MNILIRADASSTIGTGHIMRSLVLAKRLSREYSHAKILFACMDLEGNLIHHIAKNGYEVIVLNSHAADELLGVMQAQDIELLVIDHYGIDFAYETHIKANSHAKIMALDDTYMAHNCDILLNHNIYANAKRYEHLAPQECQVRCGAAFTLLRDEFYGAKANKKRYSHAKELRILVAMGGADSAGLNIKILQALLPLRNIRIHLITTTANRRLKALQNFIKRDKRITLHINASNVASLMAESDLGIITPSVSANEAHFMGLDFIAIKVAKNQDDFYRYLRAHRYKTMDKFNKKALQWLLTHTGKRVSTR